MADEFVTISRHLQSIGTATCDVSHLMLRADIALTENKDPRTAEMLMSAARDVLQHRRLARRSRAALAPQKARPVPDA